LLSKRIETLAHTYAGILGPLAMIAALARGATHTAAPEQAVAAAWICLAVFACIGAAVGALAARTVEQSVRATLSSELAAAESSSGQKTKDNKTRTASVKQTQ
jgi:hypothetical protein